MSSKTWRYRNLVLPAVAGMFIVFATACGSGGEEPTVAATSPSTGATSTNIPVTAATATVAAARTATAIVVRTATAPTSTPVPVSPTAQTSPVLARELLADGSFEAEFSEHWQARLSAAQLIQVTTARRVSGQKALYMTNPPGETTSPRTVLKDRFPAEAGGSFFIKFDAIQSFQGPVELVVEFFDGNGTSIGRESVIDRVDSPDNWTQVSSIVVAPDRSATALLEIRIRTWLDNGMARPDLLEVWVDDVSVRKVNE